MEFSLSEITKKPKIDAAGVNSHHFSLITHSHTLLNWYHWLIVVCSLILTFTAWYITSEQQKSKMKTSYEYKTDQIIQLVIERMVKYEEALLAGVAALNLFPQYVTRSDWKTFSNSLNIDQRFPGVNGIGVIHFHTAASLPSYLSTQQIQMPLYHIHPKHDFNEYWPITYIEPQNTNANAVGLDMAHEKNRYTAAIKARDTGSTQITAPIILVQDKNQTPGFLLFAPWYHQTPPPQTKAERREQFLGMVYAPFIMNKLMSGTLQNINREIHFSVHDEGNELYTELNVHSADFDADPLFKSERIVNIYGRPWSFVTQSSLRFREQYHSSYPMAILVGGIIIDTLLFFLLILFAHAHQKAEQHASQLEKKNKQLTMANDELNQFAHITSHDLKEPLRTLKTFSSFLIEDMASNNKQRIHEDINHIRKSVDRMISLIDALLALSVASNQTVNRLSVRSETLIETVQHNLYYLSEKYGTSFTVEHHPVIFLGDQSLLTQIIQNLITNAFKFVRPGQSPEVTLRIKPSLKDNIGEVHVIDNGIGIKQEDLKSIFLAFKRLHDHRTYEGTGIGLSIVKKIVERHKGSISVTSTLGEGTHMKIFIPLAPNKSLT